MLVLATAAVLGARSIIRAAKNGRTRGAAKENAPGPGRGPGCKACCVMPTAPNPKTQIPCSRCPFAHSPCSFPPSAGCASPVSAPLHRPHPCARSSHPHSPCVDVWCPGLLARRFSFRIFAPLPWPVSYLQAFACVRCLTSPSTLVSVSVRWLGPYLKVCRGGFLLVHLFCFSRCLIISLLQVQAAGFW